MLNLKYNLGYLPKQPITQQKRSVSLPFKGSWYSEKHNNKLRLKVEALEKTAMREAIAKYKPHSASLASSVLEVAISNGMIHSNKIQRICDFGAGYGGPTRVLTEKFPQAEIHALEYPLNQSDLGREAETLISSDVLPRKNIILGDGVEHFTESGEKYDLITAFLLGPDEEGELIERLLQPAVQSLTPEGKLLISSDLWTMSAVSKALTYGGYSFRWMTLPLEWRFNTITEEPHCSSPVSGMAVAVVDAKEGNPKLWDDVVSGVPMSSR